MITSIVDELASDLICRRAVGYECISQQLITVGNNLQRLNSESGFAALCGVSLAPESSDKTNRHRINCSGATNDALHILAIGRLCTDARVREYLVKRMVAGHSKMEGLCCLQRYISRKSIRFCVIKIDGLTVLK